MAFGLTPEKMKQLRTSPLWPALLSGLVAPGLGQIANREIFKGVFLLATSVGSIMWFSRVLGERLMALLPGTPDQWSKNPDQMMNAIYRLATEDSKTFLLFDLLVLLVWGFSVVDAYFTAKARQKKEINESHHAAG